MKTPTRTENSEKKSYHSGLNLSIQFCGITKMGVISQHMYDLVLP